MTLPQFALGLAEFHQGTPVQLADQPGESDVYMEAIEHCPEDSTDLLQVLRVHTSDGKVWKVEIEEDRP